MPTEPTAPSAALFLFAHQDDEFGVYQRIADCRRAGLRVACAYLTDGATAAVPAGRRNAESLAVLARLGVKRADVAFAGEQLGIGDATLPAHLGAAGRWLQAWLDSFGAIDSLHLPAWEGGHHDHDALHALAVTIAAQRALLARCFQFSLYHGAHCPGPLFKVLAPLPANGAVLASPIRWPMRWRYLRYCLSYPSQRLTWIGLFPFVLFHLLVRGVQSLQPVSAARIGERPHAGALYYEKRQFFRWADMRRAIAAWRAAPGPEESDR